MDLYGEIMACTNRRDLISRASERPKTFRFFQGLRLSPIAVPKKMEHELMRGLRQNKIKTRIKRSNVCQFFADLVFWTLLLNIQSAIIPSILGVRGSSSDSRKFSPIPFNTRPNKAEKMKIEKSWPETDSIFKAIKVSEISLLAN